MGVVIQSGNTSVTGNVTSVTSEKRPTNFLAQDGITNTTATLGTVGAGKKWTVLGYTLSGYAGASVGLKLTLKANNQTIGIIEVASQATSIGTGHLARTFNYSEAPQITAGQTITVVSNTATSSGACSVQVIEESV